MSGVPPPLTPPPQEREREIRSPGGWGRPLPLRGGGTGRGLLLRTALLLLLATALACGGGGGGGGGPTEPTPTRGVFFTPQASAGSGISLASVASSDPTMLILEVRANSVTDLYGVAFDLRFPASLLQPVRTTQGPFLSGGTVQSSQAPGLLIVGLSRLGTVEGATGSGVLLTLEFRATAAGEGSFTFEQNTAVSSSGQPLSGLTWSAGTVRVVL